MWRYLGPIAASLAAGVPAVAGIAPHRSPSVPTPGPPSALTLRYAARGWTDVVQAGASVLACAATAGRATQDACRAGVDPAAPMTYLDVDADGSTVDSSTATLTVPPKSTVDWAGLYWGGDTGGATLACGSVGGVGGVGAVGGVVAPPAPGQAGLVEVNVDGSGYQAVRSGTWQQVPTPGGGGGYQAYADVTALLRQYGGRDTAQAVALTVGDVQVATGPGCVGGWVALVAYSFADGPHQPYAAAYRSMQIFDGLVPATDSAPARVGLDGIDTAPNGPTLPSGLGADPAAHVSVSLLASGQAVDPNGLSLNGQVIARAGDEATTVSGTPGPGYHLADAPLAPGILSAGTSSATASVTVRHNAFVGMVLGLGVDLPVHVDLSVAAVATPATVPVGADTTLTVTVRNLADLPAGGVAVTTRLPPGLALTEAVAGYDGVSGVWAAGTVPPRGSAQLVLILRVDRPGVLTGNVELTSSALTDGYGAPPDPDLTSQTTAEIRVVGAAVAPSPAGAAPLSAIARGGGLWSPILPAIFFGAGLFLLGLVILFILMIRARLESG
jgi:uncharacterized repeat protein (TIGR01451 family)